MGIQDEDEEGEGAPGAEEAGAGAMAQTYGADAAGKGEKKKGVDVRTLSRVNIEERTCEAAVTVPLDAPKLLMLKLVEQVAADTLLRATDGKSPRESPFFAHAARPPSSLVALITSATFFPCAAPPVISHALAWADESNTWNVFHVPGRCMADTTLVAAEAVVEVQQILPILWYIIAWRILSASS